MKLVGASQEKKPCQFMLHSFLPVEGLEGSMKSRFRDLFTVPCNRRIVHPKIACSGVLLVSFATVTLYTGLLSPQVDASMVSKAESRIPVSSGPCSHVAQP